MNKFGFYLIFLIFMIQTAHADQKKIDSFDSWILKQLKLYSIHGASIAIIKDYKIDSIRGYGYSDKEHKKLVNKETLFNVASVSKPVTALAILKASEKKLFALDVDVNNYLVNWKITNNQFTKNSPVTIKELLTHTAGINAENHPGYCNSCQLPTLVEVLNGTPPATNKPATVMSKPGKQFLYSSVGYKILEQLLISVYHEPFESIMRRIVFNPLRMYRSTFNDNLPGYLAKNAATGYDVNGQPIKDGPYIFVGSAAGGLWSNSEQLANFILAIQNALGNSDSPISHDVAMQMIKPAVKLGQNHYRSLAMEILLNHKYNKKSDEYFMHTGETFGFQSFIIGSKTKGNGAVVLINSCFDRTTKKRLPPFKENACNPSLPKDAISFRSLVIKRIAKLYNW